MDTKEATTRNSKCGDGDDNDKRGTKSLTSDHWSVTKAIIVQSIKAGSPFKTLSYSD